MKTDIKNINYEWLTKITGDPFVDCGGIVIQYLSKRFPDKNLIEIIDDTTKIYVKGWEASLNAFFLNSTITQPAFKGEEKITKTLEYFYSLINETINNKEGVCRILGGKTKLFPAGRDNFILSGSGTFLNFHHFFENGLFVSKEVIIRMFFVPLGIMYLGDKVALIQSNNNEVNTYWINKNCKENIDNYSTNIKTGVLRSAYANPTNALFEFANECIRNIRIVTEENECIIVNLYHFTNFGANANIDLYTFPATLFKFYKLCISNQFKDDWQKFIYIHYRNSKFKQAKLNEVNNTYEITTGKNQETIGYEEYRKWYNIIYSKLLNGESILPIILFYSKQNKFNFMIVKLYQNIIRNMETKTLTKIEELAEFIIKNEDMLKKNVTRLNGVRKSYELRSFLLSLIKRNYEEGNPKPLVTLSEYVEYLFPDGTYWSDIRDLLLIAIYQKLHEMNIKIEVPTEEIEVEEN